MIGEISQLVMFQDPKRVMGNTKITGRITVTNFHPTANITTFRLHYPHWVFDFDSSTFKIWKGLDLQEWLLSSTRSMYHSIGFHTSISFFFFYATLGCFHTALFRWAQSNSVWTQQSRSGAHQNSRTKTPPRRRSWYNNDWTLWCIVRVNQPTQPAAVVHVLSLHDVKQHIVHKTLPWGAFRGAI